ncbi:MAG: SMC-Scp complex subunit ScpB [Chloroflexota bacterium]|nr:MAG: SMC-Scp complex subunit ScpB [Chloroflexota bacterium]
MTEQTFSRPDLDLYARLEALLFVAAGSVTPAQLASALDIPVKDVEKGLEELEEQFGPRGLRLQRHAGRVQLVTAPEAAPLVERFLGLEAASRLSRAALECLAIIAYQQPITRPEIDAIRGVNSDGVLKSLLSKGLVQEVGRAERPGRPILYSITTDFLGHFGLSSLDELPALNPPAEAEQDEQELGTLLKE